MIFENISFAIKFIAKEKPKKRKNIQSMSQKEGMSKLFPIIDNRIGILLYLHLFYKSYIKNKNIKKVKKN